MPSILCLLFYDAFCDHASLFLCVSMHLETQLPTQEERRAHKAEVHYLFLGGGIIIMRVFRGCSLVVSVKAPKSVKKRTSQNLWPQINSVINKNCAKLNLENVTFVALRKHQFRGFVAIFGLLNSLQKEMFSYTRIPSLFQSGQRCRHIVQPRALTIPFEQSNLSAQSLVS